MKKEVIKNTRETIFLLFSFVFLFLLSANSASALTCAVRAGACNAGETALLRMQAMDNSHAGFVGSSAYNNLICCSEAGVTVDINCSGNYDTFLKLFAADNAHVEKKTFLNYASNACISVNPGSIVCSYSAGACPAGYACLAKISADTNAHIGNCGSAYTNLVCCGYTAAGVEICNNSIDDDGDSFVDCADAADCPAGTACAGGGTCNAMICVPPACPACGNGICDCGETNATCPGDCPPPPACPACGNGICDCGETNATCPGDCPPPPACPACGNGICDCGETNATCPGDCPPAGVEICNNSIDDDGDSFVDCADAADCPAGTACAGGGTCGGGVCVPPPPAGCANVANSAGLVLCGKNQNDPATAWNECDPCTLCRLILMGQLIIEFLVKMAAVAALVSIAFGGLLYVFAIGSQGTIEKAKSMIKYTLLGFVIVFIAWALINTIITTTGYIDPLGGNWYAINC